MRTTLLIALLALLPALANAATITYTRTDFPSGRPPERVMAPRDTDNDTYEEVFSTGNALHTYNAYRQAGERNEDSLTGIDYVSVADECTMSATVDLSSDASTTISAGAAILCGVWLSTTIGTEAATIDDNTTAKITLPVSLPVGLYRFPGPQFRTSLVLNPGTTSTGTIMLMYRPLDAGVTY